jgi:putative serine protease PepD
MHGSAPPAVRWLVPAAVALVGLTACTGTPDPPEPSDLPRTPSGPAEPSLDPFARAEHSTVSVEAGQSSASGVVVSADGHILTSNTVITVGGDGELTVTFRTDQSAPATVVGDDPRTGLAVIKVDGIPGLTPPVFGDSNAVRTGDQIQVLVGPLVAGAPVSTGTVLDTSIAVNGVSMLQTDAAPALGSAGGPTVNSTGELVGITAGFSSSIDGSTVSSHAVPADVAARVSEQLIAGEPVAHPYLGVMAGPAGDAGARVQQVATGSPAEQAGLRPGDVITQVGERPVGDPDDLLAAVQAYRAGDQVPVTVTRDGSAQELAVTLGAAPGD